MKMIGNAEGLEELSKIKNERKDYLRFLIVEAQTSFSRSALFKGSNGRQWKLSYDRHKDQLTIELVSDSS